MGVVVDGWRDAGGVRGMRYMIFKQISNLQLTKFQHAPAYLMVLKLVCWTSQKLQQTGAIIPEISFGQNYPY